MIWAAMSSAGVGPLCFLKSTVNAAIYQDILEHFMLPSADKLYGDADFIFQQDLAPSHTAKGTKSWFNEHGASLASKLAWPEPHGESMAYCQEEDERHQTQQCRWPEGSYQSNLGFHYTWAVRQADCLHVTSRWWSNCIECVEMNILFRSLTFLYKIFFFYWSYVIFKFSLSVSHNYQNFKKYRLEIFHYV